VTADASKDVQTGEHSSSAGGMASCYDHSENQFGGSSENWTQYYREDLAISLLGIYPKMFQLVVSSLCSTMFIAALFLIARSWK
jgi:hypothetical protein